MQGTIDLFDQLYITSALRNDGSSTFGPADRTFFSNLVLLGNSQNAYSSRFMNFGKLRFAYGQAGDDQMFTQYFLDIGPSLFSAGGKQILDLLTMVLQATGQMMRSVTLE